jgi:N4-gp56 family major capsid protein
LEFAADIAVPTSKRIARWDGTTKTLVVGGASSAVVAADTPSYSLLVQLKAFAKEQYIRGVKEAGGEETYHVFLTPQAMGKLKLDSDYIQNLRYAQQRSDSNPLFAGGTVKVDGLYLHEHRHVPNTLGTSVKYGAGGLVEGCQVLFCGAQALAMGDIGNPEWVEKGFDYENQQAVSVSKILGFLKPKFNSIYAANTVQDFGVVSTYVAE